MKTQPVRPYGKPAIVRRRDGWGIVVRVNGTRGVRTGPFPTWGDALGYLVGNPSQPVATYWTALRLADYKPVGYLMKRRGGK
jgi:hypothetical protein